MARQLFVFGFSVLFSLPTFAQYIGFDQIDEEKVKPWIPKLTIEYDGVYHFGDSELESDLILLPTPTGYVAQIRSGEWSEDATEWILHYQNLSNIRIEGNRFFSDQTDGAFVIYGEGEDRVRGLRVNKPWSGIPEKGEYEIGTKSGLAKTYFSGKYPYASIRPLNKEELKGMSKVQLQIMRNEIFARYGYIFRSGGKMETYFSKQDWYRPQHTDVNDFLTEIEKGNIQLIRKFEY